VTEDLEAPKAQDRKCVGCAADPPVSGDGAITLMSLKHGWRLSRKTDGSGEVRTEWRCRSCWAAYRERARAPAR
jgi:hypothetical protein